MYISGSHTKHRLMYHLVWIPKYRKRILEGKLKDRLERLFQECADMHGWEIHELNVQQDHVHMMLQIPPSIALSKAMQLLKGVSSKVIRKDFPKSKEFLWGDSFWADGYFAETFGRCSEKRIRQYIRNQ